MANKNFNEALEEGTINIKTSQLDNDAGFTKVSYVTEPPPAGTDPKVISVLLES